MLYCRRYPPAVKPTVQGTTLMMMGWPEVYSNNVCGEWADRTTKPATPQPDAAPASILVSAMEEGAALVSNHHSSGQSPPSPHRFHRATAGRKA